MGMELVRQRVESKIRLIRGEKVLLDEDLAVLYGVPIKRLNEQLKRNIERFPPDFAFQLEQGEADGLRSQFATLEKGRGRHRKYRPYAFTEQGVAMLSSVLRSKRAVKVNIEIMRAFVGLRRLLAGNQALAKKLLEMEKRYDGQFKVVFEAIRQLMAVPEKTKRRIGF
jgi:hypothetical protein